MNMKKGTRLPVENVNVGGLQQAIEAMRALENGMGGKTTENPGLAQGQELPAPASENPLTDYKGSLSGFFACKKEVNSPPASANPTNPTSWPTFFNSTAPDCSDGKKEINPKGGNNQN